jgi:hypothetical protein
MVFPRPLQDIVAMKFVGGTHHGRDVPFLLRLVLHATRGRRVDVSPWVGWHADADGGPRETYRVVVWRGRDRTRNKFLARAGLTHDEIQALAARLFR